jgi:hypothetical protein
VRIRGIAALTTALIVAVAPSSAAAGPADVSVTRTYVQANYSLVQYAAARFGTARSLLLGVLDKASAECPSAASGSPQNPESTMVSYEIIGAMVLAAYHPAMPAINAYIRVASHSQWSNHALTAAVHAYASNLRTLSGLSAPKLCADIRSWAASGYKTLPASTVRFDQRFVPAWVTLGQLPSQLRAYERPDERGELQRTGSLEERISMFEAEAAETYSRLMFALSVFP